MCRINKLIWVFYKNRCVKLKKKLFLCKINEKFAMIDTVALRATTSMVAKMCKMQKVPNFAHSNPKNTHISLWKNVQIHGYVFFYSFFLSPLSTSDSPHSLFLISFLTSLSLINSLSFHQTLSFHQINSLTDPRRRSVGLQQQFQTIPFFPKSEPIFSPDTFMFLIETSCFYGSFWDTQFSIPSVLASNHLIFLNPLPISANLSLCEINNRSQTWNENGNGNGNSSCSLWNYFCYRPTHPFPIANLWILCGFRLFWWWLCGCLGCFGLVKDDRVWVVLGQWERWYS